MTTSTPNHRWYHLTPDRFLIGLLAVQVFLFLSDHFQWFPFNERKGWTVLIAVGVVGVAVVVMLVWGLVCLCLRRRFQFSFRSLLVFVVAVSVPLGWFAWEMQCARRQREAVEWVERSRGYVFYDDDYSSHTGPLSPPSESLLQTLLGRDFWHELESVSLPPGGITDDDLTNLRALTDLRSLDLDANRITNDGLRHLQVFAELEELCLGGADITDEGLKHLQGFTKLRHLALVNTQITDHGLEHLRGLVTLQALQLYHTNVTPEAVRELQNQLPNCQILYGVPPPDLDPGVF